MNIGIDISQIVYRGTGVSVYTRNLVSSLVNLENSDKFHLFASSLRKKKELESFFKDLSGKNQIYKHFFSLPPAFWELAWNKLHLYPVDNLISNLDVFHTSDWLEPPSRASKVTTVHDLIALKFSEGIPQRIVSAHRRKLKWVRLESRLIIVDSLATKNDLIDLLKISADKIKVIPLAPTKEFIRGNSLLKSDLVKKKYRLDNPFFLSVGTRAPRKNLARALNAYKNFKYQSNVDYVIAGSFGWGEDIKPIPGVKIINFIPDAELAVLYRESLGFIFPSLYEGFGLPVLEAENMGCPVIASERGSIKEVLAPLSLRINPESTEMITEAMEYLYTLNGSQKYFDIVKDGLEFAKKFSWEKTAAATLEVYKSSI